MSLGQQVSIAIATYFINHWPFFILAWGLVMLYVQNSGVDLDTDKVDMMGRYIELKMRRRYGPRA